MLKKLLFGGCIVLLVSACGNDLNVTTEWQDIPIVYAIISPTDTTHYIRIEKAFLDPEISALEIAQITDSFYYQSLDAAIVDVQSGERYQLEEIDGTTVGLPREDGVFASEPNILYAVDQEDIELKANQRYRLEINRSEFLPLVTAEAQIVQKPQIVRPQFGQPLRFDYLADFKVLWMLADNAFFYDVNLYINYAESNAGNPGTFVDKQLRWSLGSNITANEIEVDGIMFYQFLADQLETDPGISRILQSIEVEVESAGQELYEFRRVQQANTGITSIGGDIPQFTNISEGLGLFTSSNSDLETGYLLHPATLDSLRNGAITESLNFQ